MSPLQLKEAGAEGDLWRRDTFKEPGQIFGDALETPRGGEAEECTSKRTQDSHLPWGGRAPLSVLKVLHVLKPLLMDIRSKGREKPSCTLK